MRDGYTPPERAHVAWAAALLLLLLLMLMLSSCAVRGAVAPADSGGSALSTSTRTPPREATVTPATVTPATVTPTRTPKRRATATPIVALSGLPTIKYERLPAQARETIALIQRGGPFPYRQDGAVFQNRERLLPRKPNGYYHEYTVETPGSPDRGARRIIAGGEGELYYTDDHYDSFRQVVTP
jgi:ribonuclease T1